MGHVHNKIISSAAFFVFILLNITYGFGQDQTNWQEYSKAINALGKEMMACGQNVGCIRKVQQKMQDLNKKYNIGQQLPQPGAGGIPKAPKRQTRAHAQAMQKAAAYAEKYRNDNCYFIYKSKAYAKYRFGINQTWVQCLPVTIKTHWTLNSLETQSSTEGRLVFEEYYSGYLMIERYQKMPNKIRAYKIVAPISKPRVIATSKLVKGSAALTVWRTVGFWPEQKIVKKTLTTNQLGDFKLKPKGQARLEYSYDLDYQHPGKVLEHQLTIVPSKIYTSIKRGGQNYSSEIKSWSLSFRKSKSISQQELSSAITKGRLVKVFPADYSVATYRQTGNVKVEMEFGDTQGRLLVTPADGFNSTGPDKKGLFYPNDKKYILKNTGKKKISYDISKHAKWLDLSKTKGSLTPKQSQTLIVSINQQAKNLKEGQYKDTLGFKNLTNDKGTTSRAVVLDVAEREIWRLHVTGYETDEFKLKALQGKNLVATTCGIRFNYKLWVDFVIRKKKGKWIYEHGKITVANVGYGSMFDPQIWAIKPLKCKYCSTVKNLKSKSISGKLSSGKSVRFLWKDIRPRINVEAKIKVPCKPMPKCAAWGKTRLFISDTFFHRMTAHVHPLVNGYHKNYKVVLPSDGDRWVNYDVSLKRLYPK